MDRRDFFRLGAAGAGADGRAPRRFGVRPRAPLGRLRLGHGASRPGPAESGAVPAVPAGGSAPRLRGRHGDDSLARGRAGIRHGARHVCHGGLRRRDLPRPRHGEGDRRARADPSGAEALRAPDLARAPEEARPARPRGLLEGDLRRGEAVREARRLPRDDGKPGHRGAGAAGFRPRARPHGAICRASGSGADARARGSPPSTKSRATTTPSSRRPSGS